MPAGSSAALVETRTAPDLSFTYARIPHRRGDGQPTRTSRGQIGIAFTAHPRLVFAVDGAERRVDAPSGAVYLTSESAIDWLEVHGPTEAVEVFVAPGVLAAVGADLAPGACVRADAVVFAAACRLRRAILAGDALEDVLGSTIAHRLAGHIAVRYGGVTPRTVRSSRLSWREVEAVHATVRGDLHALLSLDALARVVHRSPAEFARQFRAATGIPPHRFVTTTRMVCAQEMLRAGSTVTAAAAAVGYESRYQFRRQFRRVVGVAPSDVRPAGSAPEIEQEPSHHARGRPSIVER